MLHTRQKGLLSLSFAQQITGIVIMVHVYNDNEPASFVKGKQTDEGSGGSDSE